MKFLLLLVVCFFNPAFARSGCSITFGNEVTTITEDQELFEEVVEFEFLLRRKGYKLYSMRRHPQKNLHAFLSVRPEGGYELLTYAVNRPDVTRYKSEFNDDDSAVSSLFRQLRPCR